MIPQVENRAAAQGAERVLTGRDDPLAAYDYQLPPELIAQRPARRRVQARMMVLPRGGGLAHQKVAWLTRWLEAGDLLVMNDTRVVPARLKAKKPTGGAVELLLLQPAQPLERGDDGSELHRVLTRNLGSLAPGTPLLLEGEPRAWAELVERGERGRAVVRFGRPALELAAQLGQTPLPPYIKRPAGPNPQDARRYQTVYAAKDGAVAAPTAGLHLSPELLGALRRRGVETAWITLHVGYGTFAEPSPEDLAAGRLHPEWVEVKDEVVQAIERTRSRGGRVIAVGTTTMRALEWRAGGKGGLTPGRGWCDLLISEGHRFKVAHGLLTNFHLPRTTLLMLVAALAGRRRVLEAYAEAVKRGYRFYSFGDAMLII